MDFKLSEDQKVLLKYDGDNAIVIVPESVTTITSGAFKENDKIEYVELPLGIEKLGKKAFEKCDNLEHIKFGSIPKECNGCSFCNCKSLSDVIIQNSSLVRVPPSTSGKYVVPEGVINILAGAFCDCTNITELIIPEGVEKIEALAFNGLINLKIIRIPASVSSIETKAFWDCGKVETIIVHKDNPKYDSRDTCNAIVETETNNILFGCSKTVFVDSILSIGEYAFSYCSELTEIVVPETISIVKNNAFENCCNLKRAELPSSLKVLEDSVFSGCEKLESIKLEEGMENINFLAFDGCKNLKSITIPNSFIPDENILWDNLNEILPSLEVPIYNNHYFISLPQSYAGHYTIPDGIIEVMDSAFLGCESLQSVSLPTSLKTISRFAFFGCSSLEIVKGGESVKVIGEGAFEDCQNLNSIDLSKVDRIDDKAFYRCHNLSDIILNEHLVFTGNPFRNCPKLKIPETINDSLIRPIIPSDGRYEIPLNVKKICSGAFEKSGIKIINIPNGIEIGKEAFVECKELEWVELPDDLTVLPASIFDGCEKLRRVILPDSLKEIEYSAFRGCKSLNRILITSCVNEIGSCAFSDCTNLNVVNFNYRSHLEVIGYEAFKNCKALTKIEIPGNVMIINAGAFEGCSHLKTVKFIGFSQLGEIGLSAFEGCTCLSSIEIPDGPTELNFRTFKDCTNLRHITIPNSVKSIDPSAFSGCSIETADIPHGFEKYRMKLGLPPAKPRNTSSDYFDDEPLTGLGATEDGPMICTEGQMWPCPYCGSNDVQTYVDGTAQCQSCRRWYKYSQSWL